MLGELQREIAGGAPDRVDDARSDALSRIGLFMDVDRSYLFKFSKDRTEYRISHLWEAEGIQKDDVVRGVLLKEHFHWLAKTLLEKKRYFCLRGE